MRDAGGILEEGEVTVSRPNGGLCTFPGRFVAVGNGWRVEGPPRQERQTRFCLSGGRQLPLTDHDKGTIRDDLS